MGHIRRLVLFTLVVSAIAACATPSQPPPSQADVTVSALQTQVSELSAQLRPTPTATVAASITSTPAPQNPVEAAIEPLLDDLIVEAAAAEIEPESEPSPAPTSTPAPTPRPAATPTRTPRPLTAADAAPCSIGEIKGNKDSKIYHVPTGGSYARTKNKVECFASEADAAAAGYRRARN